jgi:truncated hemoglobin YjbI
MSLGTSEPTLYERLGGVYSIAAVVDDFIDRVMHNPVLNGCDVASENPDAIQAQKHCRAPHSPWRLAGQNAGRGRPKHRSVREDRWRASEGHGVARELGHNNPAGAR